MTLIEPGPHRCACPTWRDNEADPTGCCHTDQTTAERLDALFPEEINMLNYVQAAEAALRAEVDALNAADPALKLALSPGRALAYTLLVLVKGEDCTLADVHDGWAVDRNQDRPEHKDLVPFAELSFEVAAWDEPFMRAVRAAAKQLTAGAA